MPTRRFIRQNAVDATEWSGRRTFKRKTLPAVKLAGRHSRLLLYEGLARKRGMLMLRMPLYSPKCFSSCPSTGFFTHLPM